MKNLTFLFILLPIISFAQLPNGSFENWTFNDDDEELLDDWTINATQGLILKSAIAVDGDFSIFMQNNDASGNIGTQTQFVPNGIVNKLTGQIRVDPTTIQDGAFIFVGGWSGETYEPMGQIHISEVTTGFIPFELPLLIPAEPLDSIRVNIQVGPAPIVVGIALGYGSVYIDKLALIDSTVVSTNNINPDNQVRFSPNPIRDILHIESELNGQFELDIFDLTGKLIQHQKGLWQNEDIPVAHLAKGLYIIRCETVDGKIYQQKIIKL